MSAHRAASEIETGISEIADLTELNTLLVDESHWEQSILGIEQFGVGVELLDQLTGVDLEAEQVATESEVDGILALLGDGGLTAQVLEVRNRDMPTPEATEEVYSELRAGIVERIADRRAVVSTEAGRLRNGTELLNALQAFEGAATARDTVTEQLWAFYRAEFAPNEALRNHEYETLIEQTVLRERGLERIATNSPEGTRGAAALEAVASAEVASAFARSLEASVATAFDGPRPALPAMEQLDDIQATADVFGDGRTSASVHQQLIVATRDDVVTESLELRSAAQRQTTIAVVVILVVGALSIAIALRIARYVTRPMDRLAEAAEALGTTGHVVELGLHGPREVRQASSAMNAASAGLQLVDQLTHEATHDTLTGIPNRNASIDQLDASLVQTAATESIGALMFIDLDRFKEVNDTLGHQAGDEVLRVVALRLRSSVRYADHVGRYGGDEFLVIASPVNDEAEALGLAARIIEHVAQPIEISAGGPEPTVVSVSASIGIAIFDHDAPTADDVIRVADSAVYRSKSGGRNQATIARSSLQTAG